MGGSIECEIFMVSVDSDNMRGRQKNMPLGAEPVDNREKLPVVDVIILFHLVEGTGYASNGSESSLVILLGENGSCRELRCIYF